MAFRGLYEAILAHPGGGVAREVLSPWLAAHGAEVAGLPELGRPTAAGRWPDATDEQLWTLHALSRVNDLLLLAFQPAPSGPDAWRGPDVTLPEYLRFMTALGLSAVPPASYHPFYDEIVTLEPSVDPDAPITTLARAWPALRLGSLLFSRAGCAVSAGARVAHADVATRSTLYWSSRRHGRPAADLSLGWGSSSRWRTRFRRDYALGGRFCFNVDGDRDAHAALSARDRELVGDLTGDERVELLTHRSFVRCAKPHEDRWPWDDTYSCPAPP